MAFINFKQKSNEDDPRALKVEKSEEKYAAPEIELPKTEVAKREKSKKKEVVKTAGAVLLAASLAVNVAGVLVSEKPTEDELNAALTPSYVIEETVDMAPTADDAGDEATDEEDERKNKKISARSVLVYIVGGIASLFGTLLSPVLYKVLGWAIFAAAVFCAIIIALKHLFPYVPLKELLSKKNVFSIALFIIAVIAIAELLGYYLRDYMIYIKIGALLSGLVFVVAEFNHLRDKYFA